MFDLFWGQQFTPDLELEASGRDAVRFRLLVRVAR